MFALLAIGAAPVYLQSLGPIVHICEYLSLLSHFNNITRGVIDSRDVVYYVSVVVLALYLGRGRNWARIASAGTSSPTDCSMHAGARRR